MICDMADVVMASVNEEEKNPTQQAPTPSAAHNPNFKATSDGGGFQATKKSKMSEMSKTSKNKDAFDTQKKSEMSNIYKNVTSKCDKDEFAKPPKTLTETEEEVAGPEISLRCNEMLTSSKVMGRHLTTVSTHSVSEMRQINMAGNI
jgi:hypothetical protein